MTTILVVDDSAVDRQLVTGLLRQEAEWKIEHAMDGAAALESIRQKAPDLVVTDLHMPNMNGLELVAAIRKDHSHVPVVLMTGKGSEEIAVEALRTGAASYVPKRSLASMLLETCRRVVWAVQEDKTRTDLLKRVQSRVEIYELENQVSLLLLLSRHLQQTLGDSWGVDKTDRLRAGTAIEEALLNALYHGNLEVSSKLKEVDHAAFYRLADERKLSSPWKDRRVRVRLRITPDEFEVSIGDDGPGFDPTQLPDPTDPENLCKPSGRGVMLMKAFMDEIRYNDKGNEVTLLRRRQNCETKADNGESC